MPIDADRLHAREIDDQALVADRVAREAMAPASVSQWTNPAETERNIAWARSPVCGAASRVASDAMAFPHRAAIVAAYHVM